MGDDPFENLSRREREILTVLYRCGEVTVEQLGNELDDPPTASALRTHLLLLEEKGKVRLDRSGRRNVYRPVPDARELRGSALRHVVRTFFGGSVGRMMHSLLSDDELTGLDAERLERLRGVLEGLGEPGDSDEGQPASEEEGSP